MITKVAISTLFGFLCQWWMGIVIYAVAIFLGVFTKLLFIRPVSHYLSLLHHKMLNRHIDYRRDNDVERADAAESYCRDLAELILIYQNSSLRPPSVKQLRQILCGDCYYWLERAT